MNPLFNLCMSIPSWSLRDQDELDSNAYVLWMSITRPKKSDMWQEYGLYWDSHGSNKLSSKDQQEIDSFYMDVENSTSTLPSVKEVKNGQATRAKINTA